MQLPKIGQKITFRGLTATIRRIHAAGTIDVETTSGKWFRISGLAF